MPTFDVTLSILYRVDAPSDEDAINKAIHELTYDVKNHFDIDYEGKIELVE
jgi:hypothetical protein